MNDNAKTWVATLRSGRFQQAANNLRTPTGYCCLGVATQLFHEETDDPCDWVPIDSACLCRNCTGDEPTGNGTPTGDTHTSIVISYYAYDQSSTGLPDRVRDWLGLTTNEGGYQGQSRPQSLAEDNDGGATFFEIADIIESEPGGLFAG